MRCPILFAFVVLSATAPAQETVEQVSLPAAPGWHAYRIHESPPGVWYAHVAQVVDAYGAREVVCCDDDGRFTVLSVYSGKWTPRSVTPDNQWLAPSGPADVDPRVPGRELYTAGRAGNVHQVRVAPLPSGKWELTSREIGHAAGEEFHTIVAADLAPERPGDELLVFGISGAVYGLRAAGSNGFAMEHLATIEGRVRDAVVLPGEPPRIVGVSRSGHVLELTLGGDGLARRVVVKEGMGLGRIARAPGSAEVLYVTRDDGVVLRLERQADGAWRREPIFAGDQGLRGVAAGRFFDAPARESIAVYGYGKKLQLVSRTGHGPWEVETIYENPDRGHWLAVGELDGRNGTDELIATGFGGRVVLLARPPGYGLPGVAVDERTADIDRPLRIAVKASRDAVEELSPLNYQGGFETKSLVYETLVRRGPDGRIVPGLASSWTLDEDGRVFTLTLRANATYGDGQPVNAENVAVHFHRWVGLPEHDWLRCNQRIVRVEPAGPRRLRIVLDRPYTLLPDLCAINPTAIRGPGALDREGAFQRPVGSGPFAFAEVLEEGRVLRYRRRDAAAASFVDLVRLEKEADDDPVDALVRGEVDAVLSSYLVRVDAERLPALRDDPRFAVVTGPGSSMRYLAFRYDRGPTARRDVRRFVAAVIDREALVREIEHGLADPSTGWAAPSVAIWPQGAPPEWTGRPPEVDRPLRVAGGRRPDAALVDAVVAQLRRAGLEAEASEDPEVWDVRIESTHGVPYDPYTTAVARFTPPPDHANAETPKFTAMDPEVVALVERATETPDDEARYRLYARIQRRLDEEAVIVPLYAPRRVAIVREGIRPPVLGHEMYTLDAEWIAQVLEAGD